jgi:hypothetical protein
MQRMKNAILALGVLVLAGCASSAPQAHFTQALEPSSLTRANDDAKVAVVAALGVEMMDYEKTRLTERLQVKLDSKKLLNTATGDKKEYEVNVTITRYEKGDAFARAMLAGLGQIHVDGTIKVCVLPNHAQVGEFTVNKTFAWGGLYGASTTIEDAELGFAEGVVDALTGETDVPPQKQTTSGKGGH